MSLLKNTTSTRCKGLHYSGSPTPWFPLKTLLNCFCLSFLWLILIAINYEIVIINHVNANTYVYVSPAPPEQMQLQTVTFLIEIRNGSVYGLSSSQFFFSFFCHVNRSNQWLRLTLLFASFASCPFRCFTMAIKLWPF